jgi:hypothetical protein
MRNQQNIAKKGKGQLVPRWPKKCIETIKWTLYFVKPMALGMASFWGNGKCKRFEKHNTCKGRHALNLLYCGLFYV